jgi:Domain of unknown function (DUF4440)
MITALDRTFRWVAGRNAAFDVEVADVSGDLGYTVGYERAELSIDGGPTQPWRVRVTRIYRREDGRWRLVHRHGDFAPQDQSRLPDPAPTGHPAALTATRRTRVGGPSAGRVVAHRRRLHAARQRARASHIGRWTVWAGSISVGLHFLAR